MPRNMNLPPLIEALSFTGIDIGLTRYEDTRFLPEAVQENIDGLFAFKLGGFYKHGDVHMVLNDDDKSYTVYGRYGRLDGDVRTIEDLVLLNYKEWNGYKWRFDGWAAPAKGWINLMEIHNDKIRKDDDIANSFLLDLTPYSRDFEEPEIDVDTEENTLEAWSNIIVKGDGEDGTDGTDGEDGYDGDEDEEVDHGGGGHMPDGDWKLR